MPSPYTPPARRTIELPTQAVASGWPLPVIFPDQRGGDARQNDSRHRCLSEVMYFESRGEGETGCARGRGIFAPSCQRARTANHLECGYEGAGHTFCQFTFALRWSLDRLKIVGIARAQVLAHACCCEERAPTIPSGATDFHYSGSVHPTWRRNGSVNPDRQSTHFFSRQGSPPPASPFAPVQEDSHANSADRNESTTIRRHRACAARRNMCVETADRAEYCIHLPAFRHDAIILPVSSLHQRFWSFGVIFAWRANRHAGESSVRQAL